MEKSWVERPTPMPGISRTSHIEFIWVAKAELLGLNIARAPS